MMQTDEKFMIDTLSYMIRNSDELFVDQYEELRDEMFIQKTTEISTRTDVTFHLLEQEDLFITNDNKKRAKICTKLNTSTN